MKKLLSVVLAIVMAVSLAVPVFAVDAPSADVDLAGTSETYNSGDIVNIVISLCDIKFGDGDGVSAFEFQLYFDSAKVDPVVSASADSDGDKGVFDSLLTSSPDGWETFGHIKTDKSCYDVAFGDFSGNGSVALDGELVITVPFKVKDTTKGNPLVFTFSTVCAYNKNMEKKCEINVPAVVMEYSIVPDTSVTLPKDAMSLDIAGYKHAVNNVVFYANEDVTIGDYVKKFIDPAQGQDKLSDFAIVIVDENGVVTYSTSVIGKDKSEIVIEQGSYIIAIHKDSADFDGFVELADEGREVILYNLNVEATANLTAGKPLSEVGFVIGDYVDGYEPETNDLAVKADTEGHFDLDGSVFVTVGNKITLEAFKALFENSDFDVLDRNGKVVAEGTIVTTGMMIDAGTGIAIVILGDIDCDGEITAMDYIMSKRAYFGQFSPDAVQTLAGSISNSGNISAEDYIYAKRIYFGVASISYLYNNYWGK